MRHVRHETAGARQAVVQCSRRAETKVKDLQPGGAEIDKGLRSLDEKLRPRAP